MKYTSTRGKIELSFEEALFTGYADDGGLLVPTEIPRLSESLFRDWLELSFEQLFSQIFRLFVAEEEIPTKDLQTIVKRSFATFSHEEVVPVHQVNQSTFVAELFHGPTLAFKDLALQVVGNLLEYFLSKRNTFMNILVATSGDTGSAAIHGVRGKKNIHCFVLFPLGRISKLQERQMTTVLDDNIHVIGMDGTSDDLDDVLKNLFQDIEFKRKHRLCSINSINIARIIMQTVHYFYSYFHVIKTMKLIPSVGTPLNEWPKVVVSVPSGAFGNGIAGVLAVKMGLPLHKIVVATNENDILYRFTATGEFKRQHVVPTVSPSIDIQVPYNFERFLYYLCNGQPERVSSWMEQFERTGNFSLNEDLLQEARKYICSSSVTTEETLETIATYYNHFNYLLCPHTAVGIHALETLQKKGEVESSIPSISFATAHPAKFVESVQRAIKRDISLPGTLQNLWEKPTNFVQFSEDKVESKDRLIAMIEGASPK